MSDDYWRGFIATASFMEPHTIEGVIEWMDTFKTNAGTVPQLMIRQASGQGVIVNVTQARLLEEFTRLRPGKGDTIRIAYQGEAKKAAPGMSPTKEFVVTVLAKHQKGSGPQAKDSSGTSGETRAMDGGPGGRK